jgi:glucose/arabinose dehydrogenase
MRSSRLIAAAVITATVAITTVGSSIASAASVPAGFSDAALATFDSPTAVEWLGDRIVVLEQAGRIRVGRPGAAFTTAVDLDVCSQGERGLLGLTHDPAFASNGFVYVYYTHPGPAGCVNRVSRFRLDDTRIDVATEFVLLDNISSINTNHNGGDLDVGSDGNQYVAVGDAGRDPRGDSGSAGNNDAAQDLSLLNGKILRITVNGLPAPGNPYTGPGTARCATRGNTPSTPRTVCQEIFAFGLRNPYRIAFDRNDGSDRFFINDVGQGTFEEVDVGRVGANYGWPAREGNCPQGDTPPCPGPGPGVIDPITAYGRSLGQSITGAAFVPNGLWPTQFDGGYLFGDYLSGNIWLRRANGAIDYGNPFATGADGLTDMTFGFDATGRTVLYYTAGGQLRVITPTAAPATAATSNLKLVPTAPIRAYDTGNAIGTTRGNVHALTTRRVDLAPPGDYEAALVNLTYAATRGPGHITVWHPRGLRPTASSLNADREGAVVANATIVPLDDNGSFVLESVATGRVVVDVMAWFDQTSAASDDGRFVSINPARLVDTRLPTGTPLPSGSPNPWTATSRGFDVTTLGHLGLPTDGSASAVVLSVVALPEPGMTGWISAYPGGGGFTGTSNVNVRPGEVRANLVVVPLGGANHVGLRLHNIRDTVVDVAGYITSDAAPVSSAGLYNAIDARRVVDTRRDLGFAALGRQTPAGLTLPGSSGASAVVQNLTVVQPEARGHLSAHPTPTTPVVSNLNWDGPRQVRAVLALTRLGPGGTMRYTSHVPTDFVVDIAGYFSD